MEYSLAKTQNAKKIKNKVRNKATNSRISVTNYSNCDRFKLRNVEMHLGVRFFCELCLPRKERSECIGV